MNVIYYLVENIIKKRSLKEDVNTLSLKKKVLLSPGDKLSPYIFLGGL